MLSPQARGKRLAGSAFFATLALAIPLTIGPGAEAGTRQVSAEKVQILRVSTPTQADRARLSDLDLDLTEAGGADWVDVVAHTGKDRAVLRAAGFTWTVTVDDVAAAERQRIADDRAFASERSTSALPSGRTAYRVLADYGSDLVSLAATYPNQARTLTLNHPSLEGRTITGLEVSNGVAATDGKPTFLMLGVHHAREWPSGELTIEFAHDLLRNASDPRIQNILNNARVVLVPVVNPDGFDLSRSLTYELKRKDCRIVDNQAPTPGQCQAPDNFSLGTDPNRNYGGLWGGPGASTSTTSETYRGSGPFSEPETQNVRELISARQVTTMITNHTYSNLVLRPPGYAATGPTPDETVYKALGDAMAAQMGYTSQFGYQLYDTTGTTEDWSYYATGGLGFTFEHGRNSFHPAFRTVVDMYAGAKRLAGKGAREAFLIAAESTIDASRHSVIQGTAPAGVTLRLQKTFNTATWSGSLVDTLESTSVVPAGGSYVWHVNPSTRPGVVAAGGTEAWTLTCEVGGVVNETQSVTVARGAAATANLTC